MRAAKVVEVAGISVALKDSVLIAVDVLREDRAAVSLRGPISSVSDVRARNASVVGFARHARLVGSKLLDMYLVLYVKRDAINMSVTDVASRYNLLNVFIELLMHSGQDNRIIVGNLIVEGHGPLDYAL